NSASGRKNTEGLIAQQLGATDAQTLEKLPLVLAQIVTHATEQLRRRPTVNRGPTIKDIVTANVLEDFHFAYRTDAGAFSESRAGEVRRVDFITHTTSQLVQAATEAVDAPRNEQGVVLRPSLLRAIKTELEIIWSDLMRTLPVATGAV